MLLHIVFLISIVMASISIIRMFSLEINGELSSGKYINGLDVLIYFNSRLRLFLLCILNYKSD